MRWTVVLTFLFGSLALTGTSTPAFARAPPSVAPPIQGAAHLMLPPVPKALLPEAFAGWVTAEVPKRLSDPAQADPANPAALKEYDFTDAAVASYKRGGETLSVHALRFHDASGAFGAYS